MEKMRAKVERIRQGTDLSTAPLIHSRATRWTVFVVVPVMLFTIAFLTGFLADASRAVSTGWGTAYPSSINYRGVVSLDETIVRADVIARVKLKSVDRGVGLWKRLDEVTYSKTLEYNFQVIEYLKGDGDDEITGLVFDSNSKYNTALGAQLGWDIDPARTTRWDKREAVIFLSDEAKDPRVNRKKDRYWLGTASEWSGERYSIANSFYRPWLPATKDDNREFLLESDDPIYLNRKDQDAPMTVSLEDLKVRIARIDQQLAGQSEEYRACVLYGFKWQRKVDYAKETLEGDYYYQSARADISSGLPQGTKIYTNHLAPIAAHGETLAPPGTRSRYALAGQDAELFTGEIPGEIFLGRPLPEGKYRVFHAYQPFEAYLCNAPIPKEDMERDELFVYVTAPDGTLYEAFFDPRDYGTALAAAFTDAPIERIAWDPVSSEAGTVELSTDDQKGLTSHTVDFIALDSSVALSLKVADATVDATNGMLTWKVESQPWQEGDKLMLRISG